ncbi:protein SPEC3-like [Argiope bruennichi]|uniref:Protein stum like protein n=1 Tax=Argiope bruennichi TaxID=94029 RepID=A0A8T0ER21_ARGBR|nr:protein SPEC3-like [Argiope bruennichi]KAF8778250.1 Protein stum like protein [Argiope bruennichi]
MATQSPKLNSDDQQGFASADSPTIEAETSLTSEICGFCSLPKRPEKLRLGVDMSNLCKCPSASDSNDPSIRLGTVPSSAFRRSPSPRPSLIPPPDRVSGLLGQSSDGGKLEIVSIREKHGQFRKAIPHMPFALAVVLCLMNVLLPGTGTLISAFTVFCGCSTEHPDKRQSLLYNLLAALLQLLLCPIVVGWIWSVLWGITFVNISVSKAVDESNGGAMV